MDKHTAQRLPRWKVALFSVVLALGAVAALEVLASIGLRAYRGYDGEHLVQSEFDPYKNILPTRNYVDRRGIRHNSVGFRRSSEVSVRKPPNTYRIFLMGGSTAYGLGGLWPHIQREFAVLDNSETIDVHLERMLKETFPGHNFEVINAAITSTWTHHHLIYLNQTIFKYEPDMVLFLDGFNDFYWTNLDHDQFASYSYNLTSRTVMGEPTIGAFFAVNGWWWYRRSALAHVAVRAVRNARLVLAGSCRRGGMSACGRSEAAPIDVAKKMDGMRTVFPQNALKMIERIGMIVRAEGIVPVFMLQPMLILERDRPDAPPIERELFEFNVESYPPNFEEFIHQAVQFVRERESEAVQRVGGEFLDLTHIFDGIDGQVYTDYTHLTSLGNEVLARHVLDHIKSMVAETISAR